MPGAGERDDALRQEVEELVVAAEGRGLAVCVPVGPADELVDAARIGPAGCDLLDAGAATVEQDHVAVLLARAVERAPDGVGICDGLAAGDGDEGAVGQVRLGLAVLAGAPEVAGVDGGGGELSGPTWRRCASRAAGARRRRSLAR